MIKHILYHKHFHLIRQKKASLKMFKKEKRVSVRTCISELFPGQTSWLSVKRRSDIPIVSKLKIYFIWQRLQIHHAINLGLRRLKYDFALLYPHNSSSYRGLRRLQALTATTFTEPVWIINGGHRQFPFSNQKTMLSFILISHRQCYFILQVS